MTVQMMTRCEFLRRAAAVIASSMVAAAPGAAQRRTTVPGEAAFYRGRKVTLIIPTAPGGINDLAGRLVARHLGRVIPGAPTIVAENREQGGGVALANEFGNGAVKDGSLIAIIQRGVPQLAVQGAQSAKFDPLALTWLGSLSSFATDAYILVVSAGHPARSVRELAALPMPVRIGGDEPGSTNLTFALVARDLLHLNIEVKSGFVGAADLFRGMANGQLDGQVIGLNSIMANQRELWNARKVRVLLQFGRASRHPLLPDVPLATELTRDKETLDVVAFTEAPLSMALPFVAPAGIPAGRAAVLQSAFMTMVSDREFLADAKQARLDITPIDGEAVHSIIAKMAATPKSVIARFARITGA
jgi:tripartite-type tricarboxylate transporter receptor subunit TctC